MAYFPDYIYLDPYRPIHNKSYSPKYTEVFEREIEPHEMVTQPPAIIFNQWQLQFLVWNYVKKKIQNKNLYICCWIWYSTLLCLIVVLSNKMQSDPPPTIRHTRVLGVEHICQDDFYLIRILAFKVESYIFLVYFCYWPNSFMKGNEGGIFSKAPEWRTLFLLKMKIKQNPDCPNKE